MRFKTVCVVKHPHVRNLYQFTKIWPHGSFIPCSYNFSLTGPTTASKVRPMFVHFSTKVIFLIYVHYCVNPVAIVRTLHGRSKNFVRANPLHNHCCSVWSQFWSGARSIFFFMARRRMPWLRRRHPTDRMSPLASQHLPGTYQLNFSKILEMHANFGKLCMCK